MSERGKFWVLLGLLILSIVWAMLLSSRADSILLGR
jgi:hypothetical protein